MYEVVQEVYILYAQLEMDYAKAVRADFEDLRDQGHMVRDFILMYMFCRSVCALYLRMKRHARNQLNILVFGRTESNLLQYF